MTDMALVTEADLARARHEPEFRRKLLAESLDILLARLNTLRNSRQAKNPACARQIREGVDLAVKLAELLHAIPEGDASKAA